MKKGLLWSRLNSAAAAIISSLISMMTKLVPDIKTGQWRRDTYGLFIFPANDTGGCLSVPICSLKPLPHACGSQQSPQGSRQARQGPGKVFFGVNLLFLGKSALALLGLTWPAPQLGIRGQNCPPNCSVHGYLPLSGDPQQCCGF